MLISIVTSILLLIIVPSVYASSTSSNVEIHNNVSTSTNLNSTSTNNSNCHTDITTEINGKAVHYVSNKCGNVSSKTVNGETEIKENGQVVTGTSKANEEQNERISPTPTNQQTSTSPTPTIKPTFQHQMKMKFLEFFMKFPFFSKFFWH